MSCPNLKLIQLFASIGANILETKKKADLKNRYKIEKSSRNANKVGITFEHSDMHPSRGVLAVRFRIESTTPKKAYLAESEERVLEALTLRRCSPSDFRSSFSAQIER